MLSTLFYFFLALLLLITIHEYGHFLVARLCGVKVLRFSFGFGKVLFRFYDKKGTEYAFSALPLGGYVKMLDETEGDVPESERHLAFNNQSVWARMAIVLAGPLFNFIFAFAAFWLVLVLGVLSLSPIIDKVTPNSIAAQAGLSAHQEIIAFNDQPINSWHDFQYELIPQLGSGETVHLQVKSLQDNQQHSIDLPLKNWNPDREEDPLTSLGIIPFIPTLPPIVGEVMQDSVAQKAGFLPNDQIKSINNNPIHNWLDIVNLVKQSPNKKLTVKIKRKQHTLDILVTPASQKVDGKSEGYLGLKSQQTDWPKKWVRFERQNPLKAVRIALRQTIDLSSATFIMFGRLITGQLSLNNLSGPIGIAQGAGNSGRNGITSYLSFLGFISISLGVLNLLPIPMLDGGHFIFHFIELIRRKPVSEKFKTIAFYMGLILIVMLMFMAIFNDFSRILR